MQLGIICRGDEQLPLTNELKLFGGNFKLLNPILLKSMAIQEISNKDTKIWKVSFFIGSRFVQNLKVIITNELEISDFKEFNRKLMQMIDCSNFKDVLLKVAITSFDKYKNNKSQNILQVSQFIRGSSTLEDNHIKEIDTGFEYFDSYGMFIASNASTQNYRIVILEMLGLAYRSAMQQISEQLSQVLETNNIEKLNELYADAAKFNAQFYFNQTVAFNNQSTAITWEKINSSLKLQQQNTELTNQITQVHQILTHRHSREEQILEKQQTAQDNLHMKKLAELNKKITIWALVISAFGLVGAIDTIIKWFK
jgi:hypothetical protein